VPFPEADAPPSADEVASKVTALEEQSTLLQNDLLSLKNLKFSGYVQSRYSYNQSSKQGLTGSGAPAINDGFTVRRGRLKATYTTALGGFLLQIDASSKGVVLKDAEAFMIEPWTGYGLTLVAGQTKWPFGFEVLQSSGDREMMERSRVVRAFAPGERDRGAKLLAKVGSLRGQVGVFDGDGTENKGFPGVDNDKHKDVVGRLGVDLDFLAAGISGWWGRTFRPGNYAVTPAVRGDTFPRQRLGADVQLYLDLLPVGGTKVALEGIVGTTWSKDGVEQFDKHGRGGYALLVQSLGEDCALAARYDVFDGDTDAAAEADPTDPTKPASANSVKTLGVALLYYWSEVIKLTLEYDIPKTDTPPGIEDPEDNLLTLQFQAKF
jgi:hypothetical protein